MRILEAFAFTCPECDIGVFAQSICKGDDGEVYIVAKCAKCDSTVLMNVVKLIDLFYPPVGGVQ